ncbi:MAG TPA: histidine-type phosphatase [Sphingomonas sp.]|nr:histidine-type phosphatase [Sphingomonas sp.]
MTKVAPISRLLAIGASTAALALTACSPGSAQDDRTAHYTIERVTFVMRHGIRPPTKEPAIPKGYAADPWPEWPVEAGLLTPRGAKGVGLLGAADRARYVEAGLLPATGCPAPGAIAAQASYKQRAYATGEAFLAQFAPGCSIAVVHPAVEKGDVLFHPLDAGLDDFDGHLAYTQALALAPSGRIAAEAMADGDLIALLQGVLDCCSTPRCREEGEAAGCTLADIPTALEEKKDGRPDLTGPLDIGSTASQTFLLEYLEGMPMEKVGWGRVTRDQIETLLRFHPIKFRYENGPDYLNAVAGGPLMRRIVEALEAGPEAPRFVLFFGHDTNLADLGALLDVDWRVASYPAGDIPPGGALGFELVRDGAGKRYVRTFFRAQTMDQLRNQVPLDGSEQPFRQEIGIPGCTGPTDAPKLCPLGRFEAIVAAKLAAGSADEKTTNAEG